MWKDLSFKDRSELMSLFLKQGVSSLSDMKRIYDGKSDIPEDSYYLGELEPAVIKPKPVQAVLTHYPISKTYPISHSKLGVYNGGYAEDVKTGKNNHSKIDKPLTISKGSKDFDYNLLTANCSDETGNFLSECFNTDFTRGITTPIGLQRKVKNYLEKNNIPFSEVINEDGSEDLIFDVPWYNYRLERDKQYEKSVISFIEAVKKTSYSEDVKQNMINKRIESLLNSYHPDYKPKYFIPDNIKASGDFINKYSGLGNTNMLLLPALSKVFSRLRKNKQSNIENQEPSESVSYRSYWDATPEQLAQANLPVSLMGKDKKYNISSVGDKGDTHFDVISRRTRGLYNAMKEKNFSDEEITRLIPFVVSQNVLEGGYQLNRDDNNFGGMLDPVTNNKLTFKSEEEFYLKYLDNLDKRWGDEYLGKGKGWRNAKTLKEYADILNREDLGLYTKEAHEEYNKKHKDSAYIYTPLWENNNTTLDSDSKLGGIYPRVIKTMELLNNRINSWNDFAKHNNIKYSGLNDTSQDNKSTLSSNNIANTFLTDWYSSPTTQSIINQVRKQNNLHQTDVNNAVNTVLQDTPQYILEEDNINPIPMSLLTDAIRYNKGFKTTYERPADFSRQYHNASTQEERDNLAKQLQINQLINSNMEAVQVPSFIGTKPIQNSGILYKKDAFNPSLQVHELDHAIQHSMPELLKTVNPVNHNLNNGVSPDSYLDNMNEIRSRIMELRYQEGLSPDKRDYNSKDVKSILRGLKDSTLRQELERMDYQTIADYLNNMASLNNTSYKNYV